jgi:peroxiredoxin
MLSTKDYKNAKGFIVIFTCNHCPFAKLYTKRMNDLNSKFSKLDVPLLAINSMDTMLYEDETFGLMQEKAKKEKFNFPYLHDDSQFVGKQFDAEHTPMAFVVWKVENRWLIKYKGAIDDNGEHPKLAKPFVENAVNDLLQNKNVSNPVTESFGCRIFFRE